MGVGIQKTLFVGKNTENSIVSRYFYLKVSRFNVSSSDFRQVCMFCDDNRSNLVPDVNPGIPTTVKPPLTGIALTVKPPLNQEY